MRERLRSAGLDDIVDKVEARQRLTFDEGVRLFETPDLLALGWLANRERERRGRTDAELDRLRATRAVDEPALQRAIFTDREQPARLLAAKGPYSELFARQQAEEALERLA